LYLAGVRGYQLFLRPCTHGFVCCRYRPSCSEYSVEAVERYGLWKGLGLTISRLSRCRRGVPFGTFDPVPAGTTGATTMLRAGGSSANPSISSDFTEGNQ
jgi:putative membrane protein insertion efficiency factor